SSRLGSSSRWTRIGSAPKRATGTRPSVRGGTRSRPVSSRRRRARGRGRTTWICFSVGRPGASTGAEPLCSSLRPERSQRTPPPEACAARVDDGKRRLEERNDEPSEEGGCHMADDLTVTREGDTLVIRIPITAPTPSSSGKTLVVASTRGNQQTAVQIDGKDLYLGENAYVYAEPKRSS